MGRLQAKHRADRWYDKSSIFEEKLRRWIQVEHFGERLEEWGIQKGDTGEEVRGQKIARIGRARADIWSDRFETAWENALAAEAESAVYYEEYEDRDYRNEKG